MMGSTFLIPFLIYLRPKWDVTCMWDASDYGIKNWADMAAVGSSSWKEIRDTIIVPCRCRILYMPLIETDMGPYHRYINLLGLVPSGCMHSQHM